MTFSIIVVCYNAGEKLQKTIESIRRQTEKDYEIIVEDGLSTDGSVEKLTLGQDLKVFREKDEGIYDAMNRAVSHASGRYLFFLNCGDYFEDDTVLARVRHHIEIDLNGQRNRKQVHLERGSHPLENGRDSGIFRRVSFTAISASGRRARR